jgi:hypothetical protein
MLEHPHVDLCSTVVRTDGQDTYIATYYTSEYEAVVTPNELRNHLKRRVPEFMQPKMYTRLSAMPMTPNGKCDRAGLPEPDRSSIVKAVYAEPINPTQKKLCDIFERLLEVDRFGIHDNIFEFGGHSLLLTTAANHINDALGEDVPIQAIFEYPTVSELEQFIVNRSSSTREQIELECAEEDEIEI